MKYRIEIRIYNFNYFCSIFKNMDNYLNKKILIFSSPPLTLLMMTFPGMIHKVEGDPPPLWGPQSDLIGRSVQAILQRDPRKFEYVAGKMHGRQLPGSLRTFMWSDVLFRDERKKMPEA